MTTFVLRVNYIPNISKFTVIFFPKVGPFDSYLDISKAIISLVRYIAQGTT